MNADELRRTTAEAKRRQEEETRRLQEQYQTQFRESEWDRARKTVDNLSSMLAEIAKQGGTEATVFVMEGRFQRSVQKRQHFWSRKETHVVFDPPDYAQYVFDECHKRGLRPEWYPTIQRYGLGKTGLHIKVKW